MNRAGPRTVSCTPEEARARRHQAHAFGDVADLVLDEPQESGLPAKLRRILKDKDRAHYSPRLMSATDARGLVRQARTILYAADEL